MIMNKIKSLFKHRILLLTTAVAVAVITLPARVCAQTESTVAADNDSVLIEEHIAASGVITIQMPDALKTRLHSDAGKDDTKNGVRSGGYRIQVFADNNQRTAKSEARTRARNIVLRFSEYPSYVEYKAPYWRTRIGNFRSYEAAARAAAEIKEAFPAYSHEIRIVRDRIVTD
jgi:hypothetical protein